MKWHERIAHKALAGWVNARLFLQDTRGASGIEYAVIAAMVAVVIIGLSATFSGSITAVFTKISTAIQSAAN